MNDHDLQGAVEILDGRADAPVLLTCEHASNQLPPPWSWPPDDAWIVGTHWAWDLGAADLTRLLSRALAAPAVLARFSRLLIDPNRPLHAATLVRDLADGRRVVLNHEVTDIERSVRIETLYRPYHTAVDRLLVQHPHALVLAMHTFTPVYEAGLPRPMEIGVLFDRDEALAQDVAGALERDGWIVALNEPYSGVDGLMYCADHHARKHARCALELEIRQDVAADPARHPELVRSIVRALDHALVVAQHEPG